MSMNDTLNQMSDRLEANHLAALAELGVYALRNPVTVLDAKAIRLRDNIQEAASRVEVFQDLLNVYMETEYEPESEEDVEVVKVLNENGHEAGCPCIDCIQYLNPK